MFANILLLLALLTIPSQSTPSAYEEAEAYEVYAAILPSEWPLRVAHAKQLVFRRETTSYEMCLKPEKEFQDKLGPAISAYLELNKKQWLLQHDYLSNCRTSLSMVPSSKLFLITLNGMNTINYIRSQVGCLSSPQWVLTTTKL